MAESILIIGKSKTGSSLAEAIRAGGRYKFSGIISARSERFPVIQSDVVIIATKDDAIELVAKKALASALKPPHILVHLAGSLPPTILPERSGMDRLTLHPIQSFAKADPQLLRGIFWMACSKSTVAQHWARRFVAEISGKSTIPLEPEDLPLYHAMTVFSANFITILFSAVEEISTALGQNPKRIKTALRPLSEKALDNALANASHSVLTGPIQ